MMTTPRIFRNCLVALPLVVVGVGLIAGPEAMAKVSIGAFVAVANLAAFAWMSTGFLRSLATGDGGGLHGALMAFKLLLTIPVYSLLFVFIEPLYTVVGFGAVFGGIALTGLELALLDARAAWVATPDALES